MMRGRILLLFSAALLSGCEDATRPVAPATPQFSRVEMKNVIVVLNDEFAPGHAVANEAAAEGIARSHGLAPTFTYGAALFGFAATVPAGRVEALRHDPRVASVEADGVAHAVAQTIPWGINQIDAELSSTLAGNSSGSVSGVHAYIIDTGVYAHSDLNLVKHVNFAGGTNTDCNGHGTHVAGTVAARDNTGYVVGVAPGARIVGVKVLDCSGSGLWSGIIKGIDWVTANAIKPAVANMSLGGGANLAVDEAVRRSVASGVLYAVAAGNSGLDACSFSPAAAGTTDGVVTVAATDAVDGEALWSNYGSCVDIWAPGVGILSTRMGGGTTTMSGTSMASPHVAGGAALYLSRKTSNPASTEAALKSAAQVATSTTSKDGRQITRLYVKSF